MFEHESVVALAIDAGHAILEVYNKDTNIEVMTKDDDSPLTQADLAAHEVILEGLQRIDSTIPIVSEEGNAGDPQSNDLCWLVDPLDGTKEFVKRNGMFTVNIALMRKHGDRWNPIFGVVHAPVTTTTWFGGKNSVTASRQIGDIITSIEVMANSVEKPTRLVASGSHRGEKDESFAASLGKYDLVRMGSSLKACVVAEGAADLYPRFGPTSCWDIAAAHAVVEAAGGLVLDPQGKTLDYDLVDEILNPYFLVAADDRWSQSWIESNY
tara:strand:+ start:6933 stop:7736 length:804 start_codon:yes stop_codon:yes gene_type:complete